MRNSRSRYSSIGAFTSIFGMCFKVPHPISSYQAEPTDDPLDQLLLEGMADNVYPRAPTPLADDSGNGRNAINDSTLIASSDGGSSELYTVYVGNLPKKITKERFKGVFVTFNPAVVDLPRGRTDSDCRGYGFLHFRSKAAALAAVSFASCLVVDGKQLRAEACWKRSVTVTAPPALAPVITRGSSAAADAASVRAAYSSFSAASSITALSQSVATRAQAAPPGTFIATASWGAAAHSGGSFRGNPGIASFACATLSKQQAAPPAEDGKAAAAEDAFTIPAVHPTLASSSSPRRARSPPLPRAPLFVGGSANFPDAAAPAFVPSSLGCSRLSEYLKQAEEGQDDSGNEKDAAVGIKAHKQKRGGRKRHRRGSRGGTHQRSAAEGDAGEDSEAAQPRAPLIVGQSQLSSCEMPAAPSGDNASRPSEDPEDLPAALEKLPQSENPRFARPVPSEAAAAEDAVPETWETIEISSDPPADSERLDVSPGVALPGAGGRSRYSFVPHITAPLQYALSHPMGEPLGEELPAPPPQPRVQQQRFQPSAPFERAPRPPPPPPPQQFMPPAPVYHQPPMPMYVPLPPGLFHGLPPPPGFDTFMLGLQPYPPVFLPPPHFFQPWMPPRPPPFPPPPGAFPRPPPGFQGPRHGGPKPPPPPPPPPATPPPEEPLALPPRPWIEEKLLKPRGEVAELSRANLREVFVTRVQMKEAYMRAETVLLLSAKAANFNAPPAALRQPDGGASVLCGALVLVPHGDSHCLRFVISTFFLQGSLLLEVDGLAGLIPALSIADRNPFTPPEGEPAEHCYEVEELVRWAEEERAGYRPLRRELIAAAWALLAARNHWARGVEAPVVDAAIAYNDQEVLGDARGRLFSALDNVLGLYGAATAIKEMSSETPFTAPYTDVVYRAKCGTLCDRAVGLEELRVVDAWSFLRSHAAEREAEGLTTEGELEKELQRALDCTDPTYAVFWQICAALKSEEEEEEGFSPLGITVVKYDGSDSPQTQAPPPTSGEGIVTPRPPPPPPPFPPPLPPPPKHQQGGSRPKNGRGKYVHPLQKVKLCQSWQLWRTCRHSVNCRFAHGREELRPLP